MHEVTLRTIDGRWWFDANNPAIRDDILGALAAAQRRTGVRVHAFTFMSNHYHALYSFDHAQQFAEFLCHFHAALARIANRHWNRRGRVWNGRATVIPVATDAESQLQRLDYLLGQNVKAGAGRHPRDWTGASSTPWLLDGTQLVGVHRDQTAIALAGRNGHDPGDESKYCENLAVAMTPLPCFAGMPDQEWRTQVRQLADAIAERYGAAPGERPADPSDDAGGSEQVATGRYEGLPSALGESTERVRTSAPPPRSTVKLAHAARRRDREALVEERREFEQRFRESARGLLAESAQVAAGQPGRLVRFPDWSFPPRAPCCPRWTGLEQDIV